MLTSSSNIRGRWVFRLLVGVPVLLLVTVIVGIGVPYLSGRARLARLSAIDAKYSVTTEPVVPNWIRKIVGEDLCLPLSPIRDLRLNLLTDSRDLTVPEVKVLASIETLQLVELNVELAQFKLPAVLKQDRRDGGIWCVGFEMLTPEIVLELSRAKNLSSLAMSLEEVDTDAFPHLSRFPRLSALEMKSSTEPLVACIGRLGRCANLSALRVEADELIGVELRSLQSQPKLEQLILDVQGIDPKGFDAISKLTKLTSLRMHLHSNASAYGSDRLVLENLEEIDLGQGLWPVETLDAITSAPKLHWLRFEASPTQAEFLSKLKVASPCLRDAFELAVQNLQTDAKSGHPRGRTTVEIGQRSLLPDPN